MDAVSEGRGPIVRRSQQPDAVFDVVFRSSDAATTTVPV